MSEVDSSHMVLNNEYIQSLERRKLIIIIAQTEINIIMLYKNYVIRVLQESRDNP